MEQLLQQKQRKQQTKLNNKQGAHQQTRTIRQDGTCCQQSKGKEGFVRKNDCYFVEKAQFWMTIKCCLDAGGTRGVRTTVLHTDVHVFYLQIFEFFIENYSYVQTAELADCTFFLACIDQQTRPASLFKPSLNYFSQFGSI